MMRMSSLSQNSRGYQLTIVQNGKSVTLHLDKNARDKYGRQWNLMTGTFMPPYLSEAQLDAVDPRPRLEVEDEIEEDMDDDEYLDADEYDNAEL